MTEADRKKAAKAFAEYWKDRGDEKSDSQSFWLALVRDVLGVAEPEKFILFEERVKLDHTSFIDGHKSDKHALVILKYDKKYNKRFPFVQNRFIDSVTNKFLELSNQTEEVKTKIRSRVFVGMNHNVFGMTLCKRAKKDERLSEQADSIEKALKYASNNGEVIAKAFEVAEKATELAVK